MEGMTTDDKLLGQDDIDALLGEAGIEGSYDSSSEKNNESTKAPEKKSLIKFSKITDNEVLDTLTFLRSKAFLERDKDVKVIWNANGTIPMGAGFSMNIQDTEYVSLGVLKESHLVVKQTDVEEQ